MKTNSILTALTALTAFSYNTKGLSIITLRAIIRTLWEGLGVVDHSHKGNAVNAVNAVSAVAL